MTPLSESWEGSSTFRSETAGTLRQLLQRRTGKGGTCSREPPLSESTAGWARAR